jgi:RHS repeat-associated protein
MSILNNISFDEVSVIGSFANPYKYKFQGQERQDELGLNWDSFKWRNYDYAIGRFISIDPLTEKYNTWSPYAFSGNRVIDARELEGLEPYIITGRAFIPNKTLSNPAAAVSDIKQFKGDNRNSYEVNTTAYRTEQKVRVDFDKNEVTTLSNRANSTTGIDRKGNEIHSQPDKAGPNPTYDKASMKDNSTTVHLEVDAANKLQPGAPAINYDVNVTLRQNDNGTFNYSISGQRDGFPAYEFFVTNEATGDSFLIYGRNPSQTGDTPWALRPPMEYNFSYEGNSADLKPVTSVPFGPQNKQ